MANGNNELRREFLKLMKDGKISEEASLPLVIAGQIEAIERIEKINGCSRDNKKRIDRLAVLVGLALLLTGVQVGIPIFSLF